ncbi:MAG: EpsG family protein [Elusimicrobia bacterium]|nr:EpsG family protein [Elusimicrobiota bacterium]MDE2237132.1 EpsG family protein [Elusimicrobiota bacterium]MDE2426610.1 EpsG family protein [Elusimicrobiota bacterium]
MVNVPLLTAVGCALLALSFKWPFHKGVAVAIFAFFLLHAQSTGADYEYYKIGFNSVQRTEDFPYVETSGLDAEPAYQYYMLLGRSLTDDFNIFLALSFFVWILLLRWALLKFGLGSEDLRYVLICALPTVVPVVAYWSPRSALSLPLLIFALYFLNSKRVLAVLLMAFLAMQCHSQYIPVAVVIIATALAWCYSRKAVLPIAFAASLVVVSILRFDVIAILSMRLLGASRIFDFALSKLHYFQSVDEALTLRPAGLIMILVDLYYLLFLRRAIFSGASNSDSMSSMMKNALDICTAFSLVTNVLFIEDSHIAGRVSRFPDYFTICVGLPFVVRRFFGKKSAHFIILGYALLSMLMYRQIYMFATAY